MSIVPVVSTREPLDIPTAQTLAFVRGAIGSAHGVLEIGCGDGRLAAALAAAGTRVIAIDPDAASVDAARSRGVDVQEARFPDGPAGPFDALSFTRSLHHVDDLSDCVEHAARRLRPGGVLVVEDWAWEVMDAALLQFCGELAQVARRIGGRVDDEWGAGSEGLHAWRHEHGEHGLHTGTSIDTALRGRFARVDANVAPYAYRYPARYLTGRPEGVPIVEAALAREGALIASAAIPALGRRWVCRLE